MEPRSPQGRRSPVFLTHDRIRSPCEYPSGNQFDAKSPTDRRSPTLSIAQDRRSPVGNDQNSTEYQRRSPTSTVHVQDGHSYDQVMTPDDQMRFTIKRTSIGLFTPIEFGEKFSPVITMPIPPITVSNPSETCQIIERMSEINAIDVISTESIEQAKQLEKETVEKKEKTSVMKEILAFVRKPSKRVTTRTGRFAAAFTRTESGSGSGPLIRQSTFSYSPAASSTAAKSAVTKQMSEVGFEPKVSLKFSLNSKMSLKLRRNIEEKKKIQVPVLPENSCESELKDDIELDSSAKGINEAPFELANVRFEKVGESYIKHEQIMEETIEDDSPIQIVALSKENAQINKDSLKCKEIDTNLVNIEENKNDIDTSETANIEQLKCVLEEQIPIKSEPIYANLMELRNDAETETNMSAPLQCPTFEIEPPSRRSSFDPPRSPFLENLRSPGVDTDTELINLHRLDSGGDSFEIVDAERNRESSFEDRYSSRDTSFDISRYQSTSYEDQTSSFEIIEMDGGGAGAGTSGTAQKVEEKKSNIDFRKSSIELVDVETFQRPAGPNGRKSSLETHFDYNPSEGSTSLKGFPLQMTKKHKSEVVRSRGDIFISPFSAFSRRARSPLSNQTSSNYSSRDSYDSSSSYAHSVHSHYETPKSPFGEHSRQQFVISTFKHIENNDHLPLSNVGGGGTSTTSSFERRSSSSNKHYHNHHMLLLGQGTSSGSEFEPPSPRRAASASPKHTFTFRIVLKKVDSSPDAICPSVERRSRDRIDRHKRRDSRRKRLIDVGKSF